jgi:hypothetical protein
LCTSFKVGVYGPPYRDKKVVGVFVRFYAPSRYPTDRFYHRFERVTSN